MTDMEPCLGNLGSIQKTNVNFPATPVEAPSASNSILRSKAPLGFAPYHSIPCNNVYSMDRGKLLDKSSTEWGEAEMVKNDGREWLVLKKFRLLCKSRKC